MSRKTWSLPLLLAVMGTLGTLLVALHISGAHVVPGRTVYAYAVEQKPTVAQSWQPLFIEANDIQYQTVITVTSTSDEDTHKSHTCYTTPGTGQTAYPNECTLRRAMVEASSATARPVLIRFNIPMTDTGYVADAQIWRITLTENFAEFPIRGGGVTIDGTTQPTGRPFSKGPRIFVRAPENATTASPNLRIRLGEQTTHNGYIVRGLGLQGLGISMTGSNNLVEGNWLGLNDDGTEVWFYHNESAGQMLYGAGGPDDGYYFEGTATLGNGAEIVDADASQNNVIANNVLAGTNGRAITARGSAAQILHNRVGTRADGTIPTIRMSRRCQGNALFENWFGGMGIQLTEGSSGATVQGNIILGTGIPSFGEASALEAISVRGQNHTIAENRIGVDANGHEAWICGEGLDLGGKKHHIHDNQLVNTYGGALGIYGTAQTLDSIHLAGNIIRNSYLTESNPLFGPLVPNAYKLFNSAVVTSVVGMKVTGTAGADSPCGGCTIELFADNLDDHIEALEPVGLTTANPDGTWTATLSRTLAISEAIRTASTTVQDGQITGFTAPTTAKLSALYGARGPITPTPREVTPIPETPPVLPQIAARPVPLLPQPTYALTVTVTSTADTDSKSETCISHSPCTLRRAINQVNKATERPALIRFNIPVTDTNYVSETETWLITLVSTERLRVEGGNVTIDGTTQPGTRPGNAPQMFIRDPNPSFGIVLDGGNNVFRGFGLQNVELQVNGGYNFVEQNWSGLEADGQTIYADGRPNASISDSNDTNGPDNVYRNNVIAGSTSRALSIRGYRAWVVGNRIGTRADGTLPAALPDNWCEQTGANTWYGGFGIKLAGHDHQVGGPAAADQNIIVGMNIDSTGTPPEAIFIENGDGHLVQNNLIGQDASGKNWGNCGKAIRIRGERVAVRDNLIVNSYLSAIAQDENGSNVYRNNTLIDNRGAIVFDANAVSPDLRYFNPAKVTSINGTTVRGTSGDVFVDPSTGTVYDPFCPNCTIELFLDDRDGVTDALEQVAIVTSDANGNWQATLTAPLTAEQGIRTTSTTSHYGTIPGFEGNTTSKLSRLYTPGGVVGVTIAGPTQGQPNTPYTYTATIETMGAPAYPITVTWKQTPARIYTHVISNTTSDQIAFSWDSVSEQDFSVVAENVGGVATDTYHVSITQGQKLPTVQFSNATYFVAEGAGSATITATLSAASPNIVTVDYATIAGGSATPGVDYTVISGTLTFTPGLTTRTFTVTINSNTENEPTETIVLQLSHPTNATLGNQHTATLMIVDGVDKIVAPTGLTIAPLSGTVGNQINIVATAQPNDVSLPLSYTWIAQGQEKRTSITVTPSDSQQYTWEATGTYSLTVVVSNTFGVITKTVAVEVSDALGVVQFSTNNYSVPETIGNAAVTVTLSAATSQTVTVDYATSDGTAIAGTDYTATSGTLTFAPGQTLKTIQIPIINDEQIEGAKTFSLTLSNPQHAQLGTNAVATITILDDDSLDERLDVNYEAGAPGSIFIFTASNVPAGAPAAIALRKPGASDYEPVRQLTTASNGTLLFAIVIPSSAVQGQYSIQVTMTPAATTLAAPVILTKDIQIAASEARRTDQPPSGTPIISLVGPLFLPIIIRS